MGARLPIGLTEGYWENMENSISWPLLSWQSHVAVSKEELYIFIERRKGRRITAEKSPRRPYSSLPVPEGGLQKAGERHFARACSDRTRGNGFKLKEGRFRLDRRKKFFRIINS